jgi:hypothetical protein
MSSTAISNPICVKLCSASTKQGVVFDGVLLGDLQDDALGPEPEPLEQPDQVRPWKTGSYMQEGKTFRNSLASDGSLRAAASRAERRQARSSSKTRSSSEATLNRLAGFW